MAGDHHPPVTLLTLEGVIGASKSTQLGYLREHCRDRPDVVFLEEPVRRWEDEGLLALFYDGKVSPAVFQLHVLMSLAGALIEALARHPRPRMIVSERGPHSNFHTFAKLNLEGADLAVYESTFNELLRALPVDSLAVHLLYLKVDTETSLTRIASRGRVSETGVTIAYAKRLVELHDALEDAAQPVSFHTVDATRTAEEVARDVQRVFELVEEETTFRKSSTA